MVHGEWWWDVNPLNALEVLLSTREKPPSNSVNPKNLAWPIPGNYLGKPLQQYAGGKPQNDAFPIVLLAWVLLAAELQKFRITMIMAPEAICFVNVAPKNTDDEDDYDVTIWSCFSNQVMYLCINKKCALKIEIIVHLKRNYLLKKLILTFEVVLISMIFTNMYVKCQLIWIFRTLCCLHGYLLLFLKVNMNYSNVDSVLQCATSSV